MSEPSGELGDNPIPGIVRNTLAWYANHATLIDADSSVHNCETVTRGKSQNHRAAKKEKRKRMKEQRQKASRAAAAHEESLNNAQSPVADGAMTTSVPSMEDVWKEFPQLQKVLNEMTEKWEKDIDKLWKDSDELKKRVDKLEKDTDELRKRVDKLEKNTGDLKKNTDELKEKTDELRKDTDELEKDSAEMKRATAEFKNLFDPEWEEESQAAPREEDSQALLLANDSFDELVVNLGGYKARNEA
ncbi:hypothetical protein CPC08DRAFT_711198 [Agrocybe pediades]|nr:hypothetical protein CPC08DRAFT_711198 [Agrocybe pediades]